MWRLLRTTLAEVADPDIGTRFRYYLRTGFGVGRRKRRKLLAAWDVCQPCRCSGTARMVVLCNLFSCDLSRREQRCDSGYAPRFPRTTLSLKLDADIKTNVDIAILNPGFIRSADLGWAIGVQPFLAGRYSPNGDRRTCGRRLGTHRLRRSKQRQRQAHVIRRSGPPALMEIELGGEQFHDLH